MLVRPSYVLGGQGMQIAISDEDIDEFIGIINMIAQEHPILVDKYMHGQGNRGGRHLRREPLGYQIYATGNGKELLTGCRCLRAPDQSRLQ